MIDFILRVGVVVIASIFVSYALIILENTK